MDPRELATRFEAYADWRRRLAASVAGLGDWIAQQELGDARIDARLHHVRETLAQDRLVVAFVAEFSRGKSELINAIFFADFGQRLLPSSAGRTTMCPTELLYEPSLPPSIRLLPIETRRERASLAEYKGYADEWTTLALDLADADQMAGALQRVAEVVSVPPTLAAQYGLHDGDAAEDANVTIPRWRHAIINFPHPLLRDGLVVLDTPGLNAVGIEPDLTLNRLPDAHAVLFVLAADAGVTRSDLEAWTSHLGRDEDAPTAARLVVLNKIDGLWDGLRGEQAIDAEIARQVEDSARVLGVATSRVFAVSAQKALIAKVNGDDALLARSRVPVLERALTDALIPAKRELVGSAIESQLRTLAEEVRSTLASRRAGLDEHIEELRSLRGKNQGVVDDQMARVRDEKAVFERGLQRYAAVRTVLTEQSMRLFDCIGPAELRRTSERTRQEIEASPFTKGIRDAMSGFFASIREDFAQAASQAGEIQEMMRAAYAAFFAEHGGERVERFAPPAFSMLRYQKEIARLERAYNTQFNTLWNMVSRAKFTLTQRFFETIAARAGKVYEVASRDVEAWVYSALTPLESQVKERHAQLRRRLESIRRIHDASGELETHLGELAHARAALDAQQRAFDQAVERIVLEIRQPELLPLAANA